MTQLEHGSPPVSPAQVKQRKPYKVPTLTLFGQVAALTQQGSCAEPNDNAVTACGGLNAGMGMNVSDRRLKTDIVRVGTHPLGFGVYLFRYLPELRQALGHGRRFGVMADEVEPVMPAAVVEGEDGYKSVDYALLGIRPAIH